MSAAEPSPIGLQEALELARRQNAVLAAAQAHVNESRGDVLAAAVRLVDNPEISLAAGPRETPGSGVVSSTDVAIELEQRFELRGQRRLRIEEAENLLRTAEYEADDLRRVVDLAVALAFYEVLAGQERVVLMEEGERLTSSLVDLAQRRLDAGEGTPLELNTARLRRAAARHDSLEAASALQRAALSLGELLGLEVSRPLLAAGELAGSGVADSEETLVDEALASDPGAAAMSHRIEAARASERLAKAGSWPGLTAGVAFEQEEDNEIVLGSVSLPLPLANRNRGERQRAIATVERLEAERRALRLSIETRVRAAFADYQRARAALDVYDADVLSAQEESLGLLQRALEAGEVGYAEVLVVQREVLETQHDHLESRLGLAKASVALLSAASRPLIDPSGGTN